MAAPRKPLPERIVRTAGDLSPAGAVPEADRVPF